MGSDLDDRLPGDRRPHHHGSVPAQRSGRQLARVRRSRLHPRRSVHRYEVALTPSPPTIGRITVVSFLNMFIHRLWKQLLDRGDQVHVFQAMSGRGRVLVGGEHHPQLQPTHAAAVLDVDSPHLARRWRSRQGRCHAAEHPDPSFPQDVGEGDGGPDPDDGGKIGHAPRLASGRCRDPFAPLAG